MATPDADEMEQFQRLSDQYQANMPGPLIGDKKSLSELVTEYAQADPTYVLKTTALAATHSAYRPIKGDGQCGWRGVVFAYFEILLKSGDLDLIVQEKVRLQSFEQTMRAVGIDYDIIVDMFEYTWDLFDEIHKAIERGDRSDVVLLESMNDENKSNSIVYHVKMMTSSFMQLQPDRYEPFLETPIAEYRLTRIDPANQEIDHIGLQALTDAVIAPACIAVEVSYLDRSTGDEVTPHSFVLDSHHWPAIRLIYRPGHYDLIYKDSKPVQVFLQTHNPDYVASYAEEFRGDDDSLNMTSYMFPGSNNSTPFHGMQATTYPSNNMTLSLNHKQSTHVPFPPTTSTQPSYFSPALPPTSHRQQPISSHSLSYPYYSPPMPQPQSQFPASPQSPQSTSPVTPNASFPTPTNTSKSKEPQIRMNENCFKYEVRRHETIPLDPGSFGTSALSQAHFTNSDFQPQMWNAEQEYGRRDS